MYMTAPLADSDSESLSNPEENQQPDKMNKKVTTMSGNTVASGEMKRSISDPLDIFCPSALSDSLEDVLNFDEKILKIFNDASIYKNADIYAPLKSKEKHSIQEKNDIKTYLEKTQNIVKNVFENVPFIDELDEDCQSNKSSKKSIASSSSSRSSSSSSSTGSISEAASQSAKSSDSSSAAVSAANTGEAATEKKNDTRDSNLMTRSLVNFHTTPYPNILLAASMIDQQSSSGVQSAAQVIDEINEMMDTFDSLEQQQRPDEEECGGGGSHRSNRSAQPHQHRHGNGNTAKTRSRSRSRHLSANSSSPNPHHNHYHHHHHQHHHHHNLARAKLQVQRFYEKWGYCSDAAGRWQEALRNQALNQPHLVQNIEVSGEEMQKEKKTGWRGEERESMSKIALQLMCKESAERIRLLSDQLVCELATRDELEYDKEVKDRFLSLLMAVQGKKREFTRMINGYRGGGAAGVVSGGGGTAEYNRTLGKWPLLQQPSNKQTEPASANQQQPPPSKPIRLRNNGNIRRGKNVTSQQKQQQQKSGSGWTKRWSWAGNFSSFPIPGGTQKQQQQQHHHHLKEDLANFNYVTLDQAEQQPSPGDARDMADNENSQITTELSQVRELEEPDSACEDGAEEGGELATRTRPGGNGGKERQQREQLDLKRLSKRDINQSLKLLSTKIPYHRHCKVISPDKLEDLRNGNVNSSNWKHFYTAHHTDTLQIFNRILYSMLQEDPEMNRILTNYILKIYIQNPITNPA